VLWRRPEHVAPPRSRDLGPPGAASVDSLHELLTGGWFESSPQAGLPGFLDGHQTRLHGEAMRLPWSVVDSGDDWVDALVPTVDGDLVLRRRVQLDGPTLRVISRIQNRGRATASVVHAEHPCFDRSLFAGGELRLRASRARVVPPLDPANAILEAGEFEWPSAGRSDGGVADLGWITSWPDRAHDHVSVELAEPLVELRAPGGPRVTIEVDLDCHPHLLLWRNHRAPGPPGHGRWDVLALEPASAPGVAIADAVAAGAVSQVSPGAEAVYATAISVDPAGR
jgi:hypothetical protein